jgi:hypothetical protein
MSQTLVNISSHNFSIAAWFPKRDLLKKSSPGPKNSTFGTRSFDTPLDGWSTNLVCVPTASPRRMKAEEIEKEKKYIVDGD